MLAIVDYKAGNLTSVRNAFAALGVEAVVTRDPEVIRAADRIVFPGVGAAKSAMENLRELGLEAAVREAAASGKPFLGICLGMQLMMHLLGGQCRKAETREYGKIELTHIASPLFENVPETSVCWMSHGVEVERMAPGFRVIATTEGCGFAAVENAEKKLYGVQFHPEVLHTVYGTQVLENFLYRICGFSAEWTMASYLDEAVAECRRQIGSGRVLLALSGGVDSSVAAALLQRAVGDQLTCIFVDHGLLRLHEGDEVERVMKGASSRWRCRSSSS